MSHLTFKVCILIDDNVENFYIKHYIDEIQPIFNRFKNQVFNRNPGINAANLKIYWIDSEEDKILVSCEEDFRLYIEQSKGRKIYFCSNTNAADRQQAQQQNEDEPSIEVVPMDSEDIEHKCDRRCRKGHKEEEKKRRHVKKLADKLRHFEESARNEEERCSRRAGDKRECKNAERLERTKRRVEQIRSIIGSFDPANLNSNYNVEGCTSTQASTSASTSAAAAAAPNPNPNGPPADVFLSPETTRLLSNAIAGCMQPCTVINKVLNEVFAMIPQMVPIPEGDLAAPAQMAPPVPTASTEQQTLEVPKQSAATNTSDANTPVPARQASDEIEALFKEAAKELEKMNEIVKNSNKMESSTSSTNTGVTQIERIYPDLAESVISNSTMVNSTSVEDEKLDQDMTDSTVMVATPAKFDHSCESSIEVHDVGSIMSDDSRDWTILSIDQEDVVEPPPTPATPIAVSRIVDPSTGAIPKAKSVADSSSQVDPDEISESESKRESIKSVTAETQTAISILSDLQQQQLQASVQKSIDIVKKSIQSIQKSVETTTEQQQPPQEEEKVEEVAPAVVEPAVIAPVPTPRAPVSSLHLNLYPSVEAAAAVTLPSIAISIPPVAAAAAAYTPPAAAEASQANLKAKAKFAPAVIVYDPNPKINAAVHTMMQMGFTNEDNWLTQLLINVDGDIPKALNFLTPQPKNKKQ